MQDSNEWGVYTYDDLTYRLRRQATRRKMPGTLSDWEDLQDVYYYYDAVGNITRIRDETADTYFNNNTIIEPLKDYTYDSLYRLIKAEGREQKSNATYGTEDNWNDGVGTANGNGLQNYTQYYSYDGVGNIQSLSHAALAGSYTREFKYEEGTNRLDRTIVGHDTYYYTHDQRGNMTSIPHLSAMGWNSSSELTMVVAGVVNGYYQYSGGQRIRKVVEKDGFTEERIYLGGYERYRKYKTSGAMLVERDTVHVADDTGRIAMLEVRTVGSSGDDNGTEQSLKRFIYSNHLQSSNLELDESGNIISYEEYHPYGTTAYQEMSSTISATAKRYRYTGKERDEESGLNYHGARYYAPWLCRWTAADPLESKYAGWSAYQYCTCNPVMDTDSTGMGGDRDLKNTDQYKSGIINYDYAEWKGWSPPSGSGGIPSQNFKAGSYDIQPYYQIVDGHATGQPLFYTATQQYDILEGEPANGGRNILKDHSRMEYLIMPWGIDNFKNNADQYGKAAVVLYYNGIGNFPGEHLSLDKLKYMDGNLAGWLGEQWKGALKDPTFYLGVAMSLQGNRRSNKFTPLEKQETFGASFKSRHVAEKISIKSRAKEQNTVALKGASFAQDLLDINNGKAKTSKHSQHGDVYHLENGNTYFKQDGVLKPLSGQYYVNLSRAEFKILGEFNTHGIGARSVW